MKGKGKGEKGKKGKGKGVPYPLSPIPLSQSPSNLLRFSTPATQASEIHATWAHRLSGHFTPFSAHCMMDGFSFPDSQGKH